MKCKEFSVIISIASLVVSLILLVSWCVLSFQFSPLDIASYESTVVSVLGVLITLLLGWNIYTIIDVKQVRQDMLESKAQVDSIRIAFDEQTQRQIALADAHAYMNFAEMFLLQGKFVFSYTKFIAAIVCYEKAGEHNLAMHQCARIYHLIRTVRRLIAQKQHDYVLDFDLYHDLPYEHDFVNLCQINNLGEYKPLEMRDHFLHFIAYATKYLTLDGVEYTLFSRDADIKARPFAIYLLLEGNNILCKTMEFDKYKGLLTFDLNLNHDTIAIAEFSSMENCKEAYASIEVSEIVVNK